MQIWVDADACPSVIKDIIFRAAERTKVQVILVANHFMRTPASKYVRLIQVSSGFDVADNEIVQRVTEQDLVVTADIPLAAEVIEKGALALNPRGELYTKSTVRSRLNMRDFMDTMRASGVQTGGPPPLSQQERQQFANELDKWLTAGHKAS
ncbi:YaiI/YqxD family protein [Neptunicella marina]|uniref:UPF0178 protein H8B19_05675 n=1 Tax=Neptunicella marina TaxID=2125989 RepID=A0A8J6ITJ5_9ALTE|nr:YaiI/YqxD family protein [Neptunicella marina]MBC3765356.1 YaiI/YqxD family protein [Neptunicella marina]